MLAVDSRVAARSLRVGDSNYCQAPTNPNRRHKPTDKGLVLAPELRLMTSPTSLFKYSCLVTC
jgi:hypothetical protein